jgi:hypothetical protein
MCDKTLVIFLLSILSTEDQGEYFTAILVRTGYIYLDESPTTIRFEVQDCISSLSCSLIKLKQFGSLEYSRNP